MSRIVQLNARVHEDLKRKVKKEAARTDETIDLIAGVILTKFFRDTTVADRDQLYAEAARKPKRCAVMPPEVEAVPEPATAAA